MKHWLTRMRWMFALLWVLLVGVLYARSIVAARSDALRAIGRWIGLFNP